MDSDWEWISPDEVIRKNIISIGSTRVHPFDGSLCKIRFIDISVQDGKTLWDCPQPGSEIELVIGEGETHFNRVLSRLVQTMVCHEVSLCELRFNNVICSAKVELLHFENQLKPLHQLTEEEKLAKAEKLKVRASELIKENRYEDAVFLLRRAFKCICWAGGNREDQFSELYFSVIANLSLCSLKLNDYERTISLCSRLLNHRPYHVKCLLRRATAFDCLEETEKAKKDILAVLVIEPSNKSAEQMLENIKTHIVKQKAEYSILVKKMLHLDKNK